MVEVLDSRLIKSIDRIAYHGLSDADTLMTARGLRRIVGKDSILTLLMLDDESLAAPFPTFKAKQREIGGLKKQIAELQALNEELQSTNQRLKLEKQQLESQMRLLEAAPPTPEDEIVHEDGEDYTYEAVLKIILRRIGHLRGQRDWVGYSQKLHAADPTSGLITVGRLAAWRRKDAFPTWAVQQLLDMPIEAKVAHNWSDEDIDFLCAIYEANPRASYVDLAAQCSERFDHPIRENSIRSKLNMLRKLKRIGLRPDKAA